MARYTPQELRKFEEELVYFYGKRRKLLGLSIFLYILGGLLFTIAIIMGMTGGSISTYPTLLIFSYLILSGAITVSILRSALYNRRIQNRRNALEEARRTGTRPGSTVKDVKIKLTKKQLQGLVNGLNKKVKESRVVIRRSPVMMEGKTMVSLGKKSSNGNNGE